MTSFNVDNIEHFYLTSCTDLSYEIGSADLATDFSSGNLKKDHLSVPNPSPKPQGDAPDAFYQSSTKHSSIQLSSKTADPDDPENKNRDAPTAVPTSPHLRSSPKKAHPGHHPHNKPKNMTQTSIIENKAEFTEAFARVFEPAPEPMDHSWIYAVSNDSRGHGDDGHSQGVVFSNIFTSGASSVIICGAILIGIFSLWELII